MIGECKCNLSLFASVSWVFSLSFFRWLLVKLQMKLTVCIFQRRCPRSNDMKCYFKQIMDPTSFGVWHAGLHIECSTQMYVKDGFTQSMDFSTDKPTVGFRVKIVNSCHADVTLHQQHLQPSTFNEQGEQIKRQDGPGQERGSIREQRAELITLIAGGMWLVVWLWLWLWLAGVEIFNSITDLPLWEVVLLWQCIVAVCVVCKVRFLSL